MSTDPAADAIVEGAARVIDVPIHVPFNISRQSMPAAALALVQLRDAAGRPGLGECSPFPSLTGDDAPTAAALAADLLRSVAGRPPAAALAWLKAERAAIWARSSTAYVGVELALWDLHARQLGRSLAELWGPHAGRQLMTDVTLPIMAPAAIPAFWRRFAGHGFAVVKIKVAGHVGQDLDMIHALRRELPPGVAITLDGNQGYALDGARRLLAELGGSGVTPLFFEQPLPADDHAGLARLHAASPVPVCLDETVKTAGEARAAIAGRWGGVINVKIMKSGLDEARAIVATAHAAGVPLMIGGMLESEIAMSFSLHLACGTGHVTYADLDTPFFFTRSLTAAHPWQRGSARLVCPAGAGLGLEVSPELGPPA